MPKKNFMTIAFFSSEVVPFAKTGGLADVCGALPLALEKQGQKSVIFLPRYHCVDIKKWALKPLGDDVLTTTIGNNVRVYFIENEGYFNRQGLYVDDRGDYPDNLERFQFFCSKALEVIKRLNINIDIAHCHDWQTALIPVYLKVLFQDEPFLKNVKSVLTIHNLAFQGTFPKEKFSLLGLDQSLYSMQGFEFYGQINLLKAGILFSDIVTTVSVQYSKEIQTSENGFGLDDVLRSRKEGLIGILNGLDEEIWNPREDAFIEKNYSAADSTSKAENKKALQESLGLPVRDDVPVIGSVGRLSHQKGIDLIIEAMGEMVKMDVQFVFLGVGEEKYCNALKGFVEQFPGKVAVMLEFSERTAHLIYAGSDIFLMPSNFEPCGLSQMISLKYGTIPLVYETGGLADTVRSFLEGGNGFVFTEYTKDALVEVLRQAVSLYYEPSEFKKLIERAFGHDFSWEKSARQYVDVYRQCLSKVT